MSHSNAHTPYLRTDIQSLRGLAVLLVLFYHAKISFFSAGYLGVDIFFVISGFLITRMIKQQIERQDFQFSTFYMRRAKRLLPAAYTVFLATALAAPLLLTRAELDDFRTQLLGALTFTSNIVFWRQSGYFDGAAELKPLLHIWSLSIEEQFYFILPAFLIMMPRRLWLWATLTIAVASLALCLAMMQVKPTATFYLLPTRAWELSIGSAGALLAHREWLSRFLKLAFWPAIATMLVLPFIPLELPHPGYPALLICLAALVVILRGYPVSKRSFLTKALSKIGDMSYSLYLVHWPLFAFFNNIWLGDATDARATIIRSGLLGLSLLMGYALHHYIEEPLHRLDMPSKARMLTIAAGASAILMTLAVALPLLSNSDRDYYAQVAHVGHGLSDACEFTGNFSPIAECRTAEKPTLLVWGDSYAMHLIYGLVGELSTPPALIQATRSSCGPLLGLAPLDGKALTQHWAQNCIAFNASVDEYLKNTPSIETVVLSSPFAPYVQPGQQLLKSGDTTTQVVDADITEALAGMRRTIEAIRALGKRVVVIAPPPSNGVNNSRCAERLESRLPSFGRTNCDFALADYHANSGPVLAFLKALPQQLKVEVISFAPYLCDANSCKTQLGNTFIYRDAGHLSREGSILLAQRMSLIEQINQAAR